jgi:hypothetical protein
MSYIPLTDIEIKNDAGNAISVSQATIPWQVYSNVIAPVNVAFPPTATDAFGRLRVGEPYTLFDSTLRYGDDTRNWDMATVGAGAATHNANTSSITMTVGTSQNDRVIRRTKRYFLYQPGKSLLTLNTFTMQPVTGVKQRVGYFDDRNGVFLEQYGDTTAFVKRTSKTGTPTDIRVPQYMWNGDKLDGTGGADNPSGIELDMTKSQIFWADIEWLGVGSVRFGFVIDGRYIVCHTIHHANEIQSTYMTTASLPITYEIINVDGSSANAYLEHICNSIISEGGFTPRVSTRAISTALTGINLATSVFRPLVAIRLKSTRSGGIVVPTGTNLYGLQSTPFDYKVLQGATITGGAWVSAGNESHVEYNITATGLTGGDALLQGIFSGGTAAGQTNINFKEFNSSYQLKTKLDGTNEIFVVAAISTTNNDDAIASLTWEEFN